MKTTKVFKSGNSLAVRIPLGLLVQGEEVIVFKRDDDIIIREIPKNLSEVFDIFSQFSEDCFSEPREDQVPQEREKF